MEIWIAIGLAVLGIGIPIFFIERHDIQFARKMKARNDFDERVLKRALELNLFEEGIVVVGRNYPEELKFKEEKDDIKEGKSIQKC